MKNLNIEALGLQEMTKEEMREIEGGACINFFGICHIDGVGDGIKGNTSFGWGACK